MQNENKNTELNGADIFSDWDKLVSGQVDPPKDEMNSLSLDSLMLDNSESRWLELFKQTNLSGMDLIALKLIPNYVHDFQMEQAQLKSQAHLFLLNLSNRYVNDLRIAGLSEDQIEGLSKGVLPINWTIHLKYPVAYGGTITVNNFVLMPQQPFHEDLHAFLNRQILTDAGVITPPVLYVPTPKTSIYIPFGADEMSSEVIHFDTIKGNK